MAVTETDEVERTSGSHAGQEGNAISEATEAARAWNLYCVVDGREAGATGTDGDPGLTQQAGVAQCSLSQTLQQQLRLAAGGFALVPAEAVNVLCNARINPSRSTIAAFVVRTSMTLLESVRTSVPYADCQSPGRLEMLFRVLKYYRIRSVDFRRNVASRRKPLPGLVLQHTAGQHGFAHVGL